MKLIACASRDRPASDRVLYAPRRVLARCRAGGKIELVLKALADRHRLRIVNLLLRADGVAVCVCEIQPLLELSQGTVSHHLKQLAEAGLVARESRGTYSYFSLVPGALDSVREVFATPARTPLPSAHPVAACC